MSAQMSSRKKSKGDYEKWTITELRQTEDFKTLPPGKWKLTKKELYDALFSKKKSLKVGAEEIKVQEPEKKVRKFVEKRMDKEEITKGIEELKKKLEEVNFGTHVTPEKKGQKVEVLDVKQEVETGLVVLKKELEQLEELSKKLLEFSNGLKCEADNKTLFEWLGIQNKKLKYQLDITKRAISIGSELLSARS
jgi:hypothetical protein